jgi:hypothetical protein
MIPGRVKFLLVSLNERTHKVHILRHRLAVQSHAIDPNKKMRHADR